MKLHRKVLHVDDDPQFTRVVATQLAAHGYATQPLHDSSLALDTLLEGDFRVVILDIDMPGRDGMQLLEDIKKFDGGIQVVMLTGLVRLSVAMKSFRLGAEACLFKPMDDVTPLVKVLDETFRKLDRWWDSLNDLARKRKAPDEMAKAGAQLQ